MPKQTKTQACPECGGSMRYEKHADELRYKRHTHAPSRPSGGGVQSAGRESLPATRSGDMKRRSWSSRQRSTRSCRRPKWRRFARSSALSRRKAGEMLGGGPRAFQKYESGSQAVSAPMRNLLRLLAKDP